MVGIRAFKELLKNGLLKKNRGVLVSKKYEHSYKEGVVYRTVKRDRRLRRMSFALNELCHLRPIYTTSNHSAKFSVLSEIESICRRKFHCGSNRAFFLGRIENIVGRGEFVGYQHFLLFERLNPFPNEINFRPFQTERVHRRQFQI